jgi:large subunit ribosomal protein L35
MSKYKMKTHQATKKRFRKTGSGKIYRTKGHQGHLRRKKSSRSIRDMKKMHEVKNKSLKQRIKRLAPNLGR